MSLSIPVSPEQAGIWFTEELGVAAGAYHLPLTLDIDGELDVDALAAACTSVVVRHPVLASVVRAEAGLPSLVPVPPPTLQILDLSAPTDSPPSPDHRYALVRRQVHAETVRPFDRREGPLCRFTLLVLSPTWHVLVVVAHHLVFDGGSKDILVADLAAGYRAARDGVPRPASMTRELPEPVPGLLAPDPDPTDARESAARQAAARTYWQGRWTVPGPVTLPGLRSSEQPSARATTVGLGADPPEAVGGDFVIVGVDAALCRSIRQAATDLGVTVFELLLAGLRSVLLRYGNDPVTVAVDVGTRTVATRDRIGSYVNQFPVSGHLDAEASFRDVAHATRRALHELYPVRCTPLARVVAGVPAGLAPAPVSVSYRKRAVAPQWPDGLTVQVNWAEFNHNARRDLHVQIVDSPTGLTATLQFRPDVIDRDSAHRIAGHLRTLLAAASADPDRAIGDLEMLEPVERQKILVDWNATATDYPDLTTVGQLIEAQVRRTPYALAVESDGPDGQRVSYGELNGRANRLAHLLRQEGARPGRIVGVLARRGVDLVVGVLAVLKSGAAYLPLDPDLPDARLAYQLDDAGTDLVLTASVLAPRLAVETVRAVLLEQIPEGQPDTDPRPLAGPTDAAYLIYTSGSTGRPKGVLNSHRGLCNRLDWMRRAFPLGADDAVLQKTPIGFDVSVWELLWPLMTGARLVLATPGGHRDPQYLRAVIDRQRITTIHFVPSMLAALLDEPGVESYPSLRRTICSGEELAPALAGRFLRQMPGELHNLYGPTEAAIDVTAWHCEPDLVAAATRLPIGRPIQNMRLYIVDPWGNPLPAGLPGELLIGGPGVALGYLGRPDLTAAAFIPDTFIESDTPLYRTGDRARWREDGIVEYLGRLDRQVKLRGNRIEPGEIEAAILEHPSIGQAAVVVTGAADDRRLVAYLVPARDDEPADSTLPERVRAYLAVTLPDFLVPAGFATLDRLPVTANGKLDHAALAELSPPRPAGGAGPTVAPTGYESTGGASPADAQLIDEVIAIWAEVLGVDRLEPDDDLFELGGHSLTITQIAARMRSRLRIDLPLQVFYDRPTVAGVLAAVDRGHQ